MRFPPGCSQHFFDDTQWAHYRHLLSVGSLCRKRTDSSISHVLPWSLQKHTTWFTLAHTWTPPPRSHYYYFVLADCQLEEYKVNPPPLQYILTFMNGPSHGIPRAHVSHVCVCVYICERVWVSACVRMRVCMCMRMRLCVCTSA